jgi:hypothetical protein
VRWRRLVRIIDTGELGFDRPTGLAWSPTARALLVVGASSPGRTSARLLSLFEEDRGLATLPGDLDGDSLAFDPVSQEFVGLSRSRRDVVSVASERGRPLPAGTAARTPLGTTVSQAAGAAVDRAGRTRFLDAAADRLVSEDGHAAISLAALGGVAVQGLAVHPVTGHFFVLAPATRALHELDASGRLVSTRDLSAIGLRDPRAIVIAPSGDPTDAVGIVSAYVADAGAAGGTAAGAGIYELELTGTVPQAIIPASASLVRTINTAVWSPASPDPSGLAYRSDLDRLIVVDGEVDETTGAGFNGANGWIASRAGTVESTFDVTAFNTEAVGAAFDAATGTFFISNDSQKRVWVIDPGADEEPGTVDDTRTFFPTNGFGSQDPEGLAFGQGDIFISDGIGREVYRVDPGPNGTFQGGGDDVITHFDTNGLGQVDPEGIDYDASTGHLWVVSNDSDTDLLEVTLAGVAVQSVSISFVNPVAPSGVTVAPSTAGGGNSVFVSDRGVDNNNDPTENDGKIYELDVTAAPLPSGTFVPLDTPVRVLDTRTGDGLAGRFTSRDWRTLDIGGTNGIPGGAIAVTGNLTVVTPEAAGSASVLTQELGAGIVPPVSNVNFKTGVTTPNNLVAPLAGDGSVAIVYWTGGTTAQSHMVLDVTGYFTTAPNQGHYVDLNPARIMHSPSNLGVTGIFTHGVPKTFDVWNEGGVPNTAVAVAGNLTVTGQTGTGSASLTTDPVVEPATSTLNFKAGDNRANGIVIKLSDTGTLSAVVRGVSAHLIFDVTGYFVTGASGTIFHPIDPTRIMDTRIDLGLANAFTMGNARTLTVSPVGPIPAGAVGVTGNVTVTGQTREGRVTATKQPDDDPPTSTVNFPVGENRANGIVGPLSTGHMSFVYRSTGGTTHIIFDATGYFAP